MSDPCGEPELHVGIVQIQEFESGGRFHAQRAAADLQFRRTGEFDKHLISGGERPVEVDRRPSRPRLRDGTRPVRIYN